MAADQRSLSRGIRIGRPARLNKAALVSEDHRLHAVAKPELGEAARNVRLDGARTDVERARDLRVGASSGHQGQHLAFPSRQFVKLWRRRVWAADRDEPGDEAPCDFGGEERFAACDHADRLDEPLGRLGLEQKAGGARLQRFVDVLIQSVCGQDQDPSPGSRIGEASGRLNSVQDRHPDVHQYDIRIQRRNQAQRLLAIGGLARDLDPSLRFENHPQAATYDSLVVGDDHADHRITGNAARKVQPPSGRGPA